MDKEFIYKLYDTEEPKYFNIIRTNIPCRILIENLIAIYETRNDILDKEEDEEYFYEIKNDLITNAKDGLNSVLEYLDFIDSGEFDVKAETLVDDFIDDVDILGNTEEYIIDTLKYLGIEVEYIHIKEIRRMILCQHG